MLSPLRPAIVVHAARPIHAFEGMQPKLAPRLAVGRSYARVAKPTSSTARHAIERATAHVDGTRP